MVDVAYGHMGIHGQCMYSVGDLESCSRNEVGLPDTLSPSDAEGVL